MRNDPMGSGKQQMHKGVDIRAKQDDILATERNGKVVAVNHNANTGGGKSVTVEYNRPDNTKVQVSYMHLSNIAVKVGDVVSSGQKLGMTGNTGTRTTREHLHFSVKNIAADGTSRDVDPASYLAEIAQKAISRSRHYITATTFWQSTRQTPFLPLTRAYRPMNG